MKTTTDIHGVRDSILLGSDDRFKEILRRCEEVEDASE